MRVLKIVGYVLIVVITYFCLASAYGKGRKVKVYMHAPDMGYNGSFSFHLMEAMRLADEENKDYEFVWVQATEADYILTIVADKNKLPVMIKKANNTYDMCYQTISVIHIWEPAKKATGTLNLQVDCNMGDMADRAAVELEVALGLRKPGELSKR